MRLFGCSDHHFGHKLLTELRGFGDDIAAHNAAVIDAHKVIDDDDLVLILGDPCMGKRADSIPMLGLIPGRKFVVPGNHDTIHPEIGDRRPHKRAEHLALYEEHVTVLPTQIDFRDEWGSVLLTLSHFPPYGDSGDEDRYVAQRPQDVGQIFLHGHTHSSEVGDGRINHVGIDAYDLGPVDLSSLLSDALHSLLVDYLVGA